MRAIILVRLSDYSGADDTSTSPERQEKTCRAYCEAKGWTVADVVIDLDVSASARGLRLNRPGLNRIRAMWGLVDVVVFAKIDRLARNTMDFRAFAEEAASNGAALVSVHEGLDMTTPAGTFVATILAAFAEMESDVIAERTREGMRAARKLGRWGGGRTPFGYTAADNPSGPGRTLVVNPDEAAVIREAADRLLAGDTIRSITRYMNESGQSPHQASAWYPHTVLQVLTGESVQGRTGTNDENGRRQPLRDDTGQIVAPFEPILSPDQVAAIRATRKVQGAPRGRFPTRLLSGVLVCGNCGERLNVGSRSARDIRYACVSRSLGRGCPAGVSIKAEPAEDHVASEYMAAFGRLPLVLRRLVVASTGLAEAEESKASALAALGSSPTTAAFEALQDAQRRVDEIVAAPPDPQVVYMETGRTIATTWDAAETDERRALLTDALRDGTIRIAPAAGTGRRFDPARVNIRWREDEVD